MFPLTKLLADMSKSYPRVLIINSTAFGDHSATAITLTNLFQGWPLDRLALAHGDSHEPAQNICPRCWRYSLTDVPVDRTIRRLLGKRKNLILGNAAPGMPSGLGSLNGIQGTSPRELLHGIACAWADLLPFRPTPAFWTWVDEFQPQVIYSMLGNIRLMNLVLRVSKHCDTPIIPHFMDDWPTTHYRGLTRAIPRAIMMSRLKNIIHRSPMGMTICETMATEYRKRFNIGFEAFMNCVNVPDTPPAASAGEVNHPIQFVYAGGLHLNRWKSLMDIGRALVTLINEGYHTELLIYAPADDMNRYAATFSALPTVRLGGSLHQDQMTSAMRTADVLVHVESFDPTIRQYTRLSLSTKVPQYMACARPMVAYGPAEVASSRYIQESECGYVIGTEDNTLLATALRTLVSDPNLRNQLGQRAWETARKRHTIDIVRENFRVAMLGTANPMLR